MRLRGDHEVGHRDHRLVILPTALLVFHLQVVEPEGFVDPVLQVDHARAHGISTIPDRLDRGEQFPTDPFRPVPRISAQMRSQIIPVNLRRAQPEVLDRTGLQLDLQISLRTEHAMVLNKGDRGIPFGHDE